MGFVGDAYTCMCALCIGKFLLKSVYWVLAYTYIFIQLLYSTNKFITL